MHSENGLKSSEDYFLRVEHDDITTMLIAGDWNRRSEGYGEHLDGCCV